MELSISYSGATTGGIMEEFTTLDTVRDFEVSGNQFRNPSNEYWALFCFAQGLSLLNNRVKHCEELVCEKIGDDVKHMVFSPIGSREEFRIVSLPLITMSFHWYAVSACQYVRVISAMNLPEGLTKKQVFEFRRDYENDVISDLVPFRDKVAAHIAGLTKNSNDNVAERKFSLLPLLSFIRGKFRVAANTLTNTSGGNTTDSSEIKSWSLTDMHERLMKRYPLIREITEANSLRSQASPDPQSHQCESLP